jgi:hypothetical protein
VCKSTAVALLELLALGANIVNHLSPDHPKLFEDWGDSVRFEIAGRENGEDDADYSVSIVAVRDGKDLERHTWTLGEMEAMEDKAQAELVETLRTKMGGGLKQPDIKTHPGYGESA